MTTTDTLLADLADVLDRASKLAAQMAETLAIPDDPLREYRLPGGRVAYQEETVEHVMAGDWFQRRHGDTEWHQVERAPGSDSSICLQYRTPSGPTHEWFERGSKVRIATAPVPDPEPWRRAWR
jgi:hypothetical protein